MSRSSPHRYDAQNAKCKPEALPRLHEVLGDMLEYPPPKPLRDYGSYDSSSLVSSPFASSSSPRITSNSANRLPPIQTPMSPEANHYPTPSMPLHLRSTRDDYSEHPTQIGTPRGEPARYQNTHQSQGTASHSYDVFHLTSQQELAHKRSSMKDDHCDVAKEIAISSSSGKYLCSECGRRFQKNSTLKNHLTTHSGERPYECPDCRKTFSVSSNMRRHLERVHRSGGTPGK